MTTLIDFNGKAPNWGSTGETVYNRTYRRVKPNGEFETWGDTVVRVTLGNFGLVYGTDWDQWPDEIKAEANEFANMLFDFKIIPAGRHLWASGVKGRQYLFNCHVAPWGDTFSRHFEFTFMRLMEGGGVGANYSSRFLKPYGTPKHELKVHIVCDPSHPDYQSMKDAGVLSDDYPSDWDGAFEVEDSREGWSAAMVDLMDTYYADDVEHENRVYDVTNVRASGSRLKTFGGTASGPQPFAVMMLKISEVLNGPAVRFWEGQDYVTPLEAMEIDHAIAECVVSGGNRRSARMSIVEWDDPFIMDFIECKNDPSKHWTTNISVAIDNDFISDLNSDTLAREVHEAVVKGMLANGEPGYWNRSLSQQGEVNEVIATNPCGEITLEPAENCNIGSVNLQAFVDDNGNPDVTGLHRAHMLMTRFLIRATYGDVNDSEQAEKLARNRRIGVGHMGMQGYLALQGHSLDAGPSTRFASDLRGWRTYVRRAARDYAFELRIPEPVKVTTEAPTGSIAKLAGVSEGAHPIYARYFIRRVRFSLRDPEQVAQIEKFKADGYNVEPDVYDASGMTAVVEFPTKDALVARAELIHGNANMVQSADQLTLEEMLDWQAMIQENYTDNAVSFTVNVPEGKYTVDEAMDIIGKYLPRLKGTTIMPDGTRPQAPYQRITHDEFRQATVQDVSDGIDEDCANGACPIR